MKTLCLPLTLLLALAGCSKKPDPQSGPQKSLEQDLTATVLPEMVGTFQSPKAELRISASGQFVLLTKKESARWYAHSGPDQRQHNASCDFRREGTVQVVEKAGTRVLRFNITQRLLDSASTDARSADETPATVCSTILGVLNARREPKLEFSLTQSKNGAFLLQDVRPDSQPYSIYGDDGNAGNLHADSTFSGEFALLFTPAAGTLDVTSLVSGYLAGEYRGLGNSQQPEVTMSIDGASQAIRVVSKTCGIDQTWAFQADANGAGVRIRLLSGFSVPAETRARDNSTLDCSPLYDAFTTRQGDVLFETSDLYYVSIRRGGRQMTFEKKYRD